MSVSPISTRGRGIKLAEKLQTLHTWSSCATWKSKCSGISKGLTRCPHFSHVSRSSTLPPSSSPSSSNSRSSSCCRWWSVTSSDLFEVGFLLFSFSTARGRDFRYYKENLISTIDVILYFKPKSNYINEFKKGLLLQFLQKICTLIQYYTVLPKKRDNTLLRSLACFINGAFMYKMLDRDQQFEFLYTKVSLMIYLDSKHFWALKKIGGPRLQPTLPGSVSFRSVLGNDN